MKKQVAENDFTTDVDKYEVERAGKMLLKAELQLETDKAHYVNGKPMNVASAYSEANAQTKINWANFVLNINQKTR